MGLLSGLFGGGGGGAPMMGGGGGGGMPMPPMGGGGMPPMPMGGGGMGMPQLSMPPPKMSMSPPPMPMPMPRPPQMPMGGPPPGMGMPMGKPPMGGMPPMGGPMGMPGGGAPMMKPPPPLPMGGPPGGAPPMPGMGGMPPGARGPGGPLPMPSNPNSIPGGPATSWRPQSAGQMVSQANQMLQKMPYDAAMQNPQFQNIMKNLDGGILKNVPGDLRASTLDQIGNLRSQLGNQLIPSPGAGGRPMPGMPMPNLPGQMGQKPPMNVSADVGGAPALGAPGAPPALGAPQMPGAMPGMPGTQLAMKSINNNSLNDTKGGYMDYAKQFVGMNEAKHHGVLNQFFKQSIGQNIDPRYTAWCAAFVNGVLKKNGLTGTGSLMARSFLGYGQKVAPNAIRPGDIVVFGRGKAPSGHVGFVNSFNAKTGVVNVLSGNQHNAVTLKDYPIGKALGFRRIIAPQQ